jgi:hypothetical protein
MKREFKILEKSRFIFKHPINASDFNPELFDVSHFQEIDDVYMYSQLGTIVDVNGFAYSFTNIFFYKTKRNSDFVNQCILLKNFFSKKSKFIFRRKVILLFDEWSDNYYHFLNEFVTRLFVCKEFILKEKIILIVPYKLKDKIKIFTDLMGICKFK